MYIYMYVYIYICMYIYVYIYMYIYIYRTSEWGYKPRNDLEGAHLEWKSLLLPLNSMGVQP